MDLPRASAYMYMYMDALRRRKDLNRPEVIKRAQPIASGRGKISLTCTIFLILPHTFGLFLQFMFCTDMYVHVVQHVVPVQ